MKILSNFNTALDQDLLREDTIIVKKHPLFLLQSIFPFLFFLICYGGIMYLNQSGKGTIGLIIDGIFTLVFLFWFWKIASYTREYLVNFRMFYTLKDKKLLEENDKHFDAFLKMSFFIIALNIVISLVNLGVGVFLIFQMNAEFSFEHTKEIGLLLLSIFLNLGMIFIQIHLFKKCIDLEMDFCAFTQAKISYVNQLSFLSKEVSELRYDKVTNISVNKKGILHALFDYGDILIFTEGEDTQEKTKVPYVKNPMKVREILNELFEGSFDFQHAPNNFVVDQQVKTHALDTRSKIKDLI